MKMRQLFWGVALVLFGLIALASTLGWLRGLNIWALIGPYFLIVLGAWFLLRPALLKGEKIDAESYSLPLGDAREARIKLEHGAGRLTLHPGAESGNLLSGSFAGGIIPTISREGLILSVSLKSDLDVITVLPPIPGGEGLEWNVSLTNAIPLSIELHSGASESILDLTDLMVKYLSVETGASSTRVMLPKKAGISKVKVESGAASVDLVVPEGVAAKIRVESAIASNNIDTSRFPRKGKGYQSADYDTAVNKVDIDVETGVGSISIK